MLFRSAVTVNTLVPSTVIGGNSGINQSSADQYDTTKSLTSVQPASGSVTGAWVRLVFTALDATNTAIAGIPTTVTVSNGFLINSLGKIGTSRIVYANDPIYILGLKTGLVTVTATNGTLSATATIRFTNAPTYPDTYYDTATSSNAQIGRAHV